jgi:hypothetical protein
MKLKAFAFSVAWAWLGAVAAAQTLPSEPITFGNGRIVLGADASVAIAPQDTAFFNYSDYDHSTMRQVRLGMTALVRASDRISFLGELRSENMDHPAPYALYARVRPFPKRRLDVQIGRIPPTFGRFPRQAYSRDNPLIGYPLAYQYLTSLRPDAIPKDADELLRMRGRGWLSSFSIGDPTPHHGVPLITAFNWDTGVQVTTGWKLLTVTGSLTNGTASNPRVSDDNSGKQIATRVSVQPVIGLVIGSSFAHGDFLSRRVLTAAGVPDGSFGQRANGLDVEYSRRHWLARADAVLSRWRLPVTATHGVETLDAVAISAEGRYSFLPGAYAAVRLERLGFSDIVGSRGPAPWEAPVRRVEIGGGYYLQRNVIARVSWQFNERDTTRFNRARLAAAQLLFWF